MVRLYGLRACVIRALHYTYPPFVEKLKAVTTFEGDPHNLTKRQCVLMWHQVTCRNYIALPMVMGLTLCSVSLTGIRHHRLQLSFGSGHMCFTAGKPNTSSLDCSTVVLDPVVNVRVLDWWHPNYPHAANTTFNTGERD
ncbi:Transmembrane protein 183 [Blattella germanica]|nr:Transmembrane protein 183 [Blattella germanica]